MVALNSGSLDSLPSPLDTIAKLSMAVGALDRNLDRLNRASLGRDSLFFEVMAKSASFELDLTKQNNLLVLVNSSSSLTFTLTASDSVRVGMSVIFYDNTRNSETYPITINRNGNTINGSTDNLTIAKNGGYVWLKCTEVGKWVSILNSTGEPTVTSSVTVNASSSGYPTAIPLIRSDKFHYVEVVSTSAAMTINLPVGDLANTNIKPNDTFIIKDSSENSETYNITINLNGGRINAVNANPVIAKNGGFIWLRYAGWDSVNSWGMWEVIIQDINPILYSKFNPVGANAAWVSSYSNFSAIFGANVLAGVSGSTGGGFYGLAYRGTAASPTATQSGDLLCHLRGHGYDGAAFVGGGGVVQISTTQNWDLTSRGGSVSVRTVGNGTTTLGTAAIFGQDKITTFSAGLRLTASNTHDVWSAAFPPSNTYGWNAFTTVSDPRTKKEIKRFLFNEELLDKLIETECFISWIWKDFENQEIFQKEKQTIIDPGTKEEREIEVSILVQPYYKSNHKRRHCGSHAFRILKVLIGMGISTEDFPIVSIENYTPKMMDLIRDMTEEEFLSTSEDVIGRLTIKNELYIPLIANVAYRQGQKLKAVESRLQAIEVTLGI